MEAKVYNQKGKESGKIKLPENVFSVSWNGDLVHQVVTALFANRRPTVADTKGRGEVRGGGKKPWRQKGTGRARHGSSRSPIWKGGGVTHGPSSERDYTQKINKKMKNKALFCLLSKKVKDGEVMFVDSLDLKDVSTKSASEVVKNLASVSSFEKLLKARTPKAYVVFAKPDRKAHLSFRNIPSVTLGTVSSLDTLEVANRKYVIFVGADEVVDSLSKKVEAKKK